MAEKTALKLEKIRKELFGSGQFSVFARRSLVTGEERYLDLAKFFLDKRGENEHRSTYHQSHKKVTEQEEAVGHSVRAAYMYTAMADIAALTGDQAYLDAMDKLWHDIVDGKLYIIGGIGAAGGHEGFGGKYELPNLRAYNETCAGIANVFWNYRLFLTHGEAKYLDVLERALYNNVLAGVSLDGNEFFYPNRLESEGDTKRSEWFNTSCCPSNISRYLPSVPGYIYAHTEEALYVNLFISSDTKVQLAGQEVAVRQRSGMPWSGLVRLEIEPERAGQFEVRVRIPGWAGDQPVPSDLYTFTSPPSRQTTIRINGESVSYITENGYAVLGRNWQAGDVAELEFPYEVRRVKAHPSVTDNAGRLALQAGPLVYCIEGADYPDGRVHHLLLKEEGELRLVYEKDLLGGVTAIHGSAQALRQTATGAVLEEKVPFKAIPYHTWANRGAGEMLVWLPVEAAAVQPLPADIK